MAEFQASGLLATASADRTIRIWNTSTLKTTAKWNAPPQVGRALAFSADGRLLALGMHEGSVTIFDAANGTQVAHWKAHEAEIRDLVWLKDDRQIITAGDDGKILVWNASTGDLGGSFVGHEGQVLDIALSGDEREPPSGGTDCKPGSGTFQRTRCGSSWKAIGTPSTLSVSRHTGAWSSRLRWTVHGGFGPETSKECRTLDSLQHPLCGMAVVPGGQGVAVIELKGL